MDQVTLLAGERQKSESFRAIQACNDYLRMGPARSLAELVREYGKTTQKQAPTRSKGTIEKWSAAYDWANRAATYDTALEAEKNARAEAIMQEGLATAHGRVEKLKELGDLLWEQMHEVGEDGVLHNIWLPDAKQLGTGEFSERYDLEHFNAAIIKEYRGTLDDIAKETGGRVAKSEISGKDGGPVALEIVERIVDGGTIAADDRPAPDTEGVSR